MCLSYPLGPTTSHLSGDSDNESTIHRGTLHVYVLSVEGFSFPEESANLLYVPLDNWGLSRRNYYGAQFWAIFATNTSLQHIAHLLGHPCSRQFHRHRSGSHVPVKSNTSVTLLLRQVHDCAYLSHIVSNRTVYFIYMWHSGGFSARVPRYLRDTDCIHMHLLPINNWLFHNILQYTSKSGGNCTQINEYKVIASFKSSNQNCIQATRGN